MYQLCMAGMLSAQKMQQSNQLGILDKILMCYFLEIALVDMQYRIC
jgi:hypothetical protein